MTKNSPESKGSRRSKVEGRRGPPVSYPRRSTLDPRPALAAFTLMEIMVVVGIIGLIMAMGVPSLYRMLHREGFTRTVGDVMDLCSVARSQAILQGVKTEIVFHPLERWCELGGGAAGSAAPAGAPKGPTTEVRFGDNVAIRMLDINLLEYNEAPIASVRFFPDGTSDELTLILQYFGSDRSEWRRISLEVTTGLASLDSDPSHWR